MATDRLANRWGIAVAAVVTQLCLGAVYGWSVFVKPLISAEHWTLTQVSLAFTLSIVCLGFGTVVGGLWQDRVGPRRVLSVAGVLYGAGYMLAALGASHHSLARLYLGYGLLAGFGMGMGYIVPVATLVKWFPDRRGLMTGVAVCGYGAGALVMSPLAAREILAYGVPATFLTLGIVYLAVVVLTAQFYRIRRRAGVRRDGSRARPSPRPPPPMTSRSSEAMSTPQFWLLLVMLFLNVSAGIMVISQASPMAQQLVGLTPGHRRGHRRRHLHLQWTGPRLLGRGLRLAGPRPRLSSCCTWFRSASSSRCRICTPRRCSPRRWPPSVSAMAAASAPCRHLPRTSSAPSTWAESMAGFCWPGALGAVPSPILIARVRQTTGMYQPAIHVIAIVMVCSLVLPLLAHRPKHEPGKPVATTPEQKLAA